MSLSLSDWAVNWDAFYCDTVISLQMERLTIANLYLAKYVHDLKKQRMDEKHTNHVISEKCCGL